MGALPGDFNKLWLSHALTNVAAKSSAVVLPLIAVFSFHATPGQVGLVTSAQMLPVFLVTLFAGGWLDRRPRRPNLLFAHLLRGLAMLAVPIAAFLDSQGISVLCAVAFGSGVMTALADVTYPVYVPSLVGGELLVEANTRLEAVNSLTQLAAPGAGGLLLGVIGGQWCMILASLAYFLGAAAILAVRTAETPPPATRQTPGEARHLAGVLFLARAPLLRLLVLQAAWFNLFEQSVVTVYLVYAVRTLGLSASLVGLSMSVGAVGALLGSSLARRCGRVVGPQRTLLGGMFLACAGPLLIPLAQRSLVPLPFICGAFVCYGFGLATFNIFSVSVRQRTTPPDVLGRVTAAFRFIGFGTIWLGALVGGALSEWLGLQTALWTSVVALLAGYVVFAVRFTVLVRTDQQIRARIASLTKEHRT